jgi:hypothetical protein
MELIYIILLCLSDQGQHENNKTLTGKLLLLEFPVNEIRVQVCRLTYRANILNE